MVKVAVNPAAVTVWEGRSMVTTTSGSSAISANRAASSSVTTTVSSPMLTQLLAKMSANDGAITAWKPQSSRAHGACSRDDPDPKFGPLTSTVAPRHSGRLSTKSGTGSPSASSAQSWNRNGPNPVRSMRLRNCLGMIWSVSTLARGSGTMVPVTTVTGFTTRS